MLYFGFSNRGNVAGEIRMRKRSRSQHDTLHGLITNISEENIGIEESTANNSSPIKNDEIIKTIPLVTDTLQTRQIENYEPLNHSPTNPTKGIPKEFKNEYVVGDEFHSLAVVAFPLSSISPGKCPPSNRNKGTKRNTCDQSNSKKRLNPCHTVLDSNEQAYSAGTMLTQNGTTKVPLSHSHDCKNSTKRASGSDTNINDSSENSSLPLSCESMSLFDGVTVKIQYIFEEECDSPVVEAKNINNQSTNDNNDTVPKMDVTNSGEASKVAISCNGNSLNVSLENEKFIFSTSNNKVEDKETNNKATTPCTSQIKAETNNSTLSYLHDISLRKPTCDLTIPLRQPLSANYREQRTRGKCSPLTAPIINTTVEPNISFHDCKSVLDENFKQNKNELHAKKSFNRSKTTRNGAYIIKYEAKRSENIKGCGNGEHKRNQR